MHSKHELVSDSIVTHSSGSGRVGSLPSFRSYILRPLYILEVLGAKVVFQVAGIRKHGNKEVEY